MDPTKMAEKQAKLAQTALSNPEYRFDNLYDLMHWRYWIEQAAAKVLARPGSSTAGVDGKTRDNFKDCYETEINRITAELKSKTYEPLPVKRTHIPKGNGKTRPLGIPMVRAYCTSFKGCCELARKHGNKRPGSNRASVKGEPASQVFVYTNCWRQRIHFVYW